jgi:hypothetical protein
LPVDASAELGLRRRGEPLESFFVGAAVDDPLFCLLEAHKREESNRVNSAPTQSSGSGEFMNRLLIVAILMLSTAPLYAQGQQQNVAKLKEDARNAVGIIGADRGKTQSYCQIVDLLGRQLDQEKNKKKNKALSQRIDQLQKKVGLEFVVLENILTDIDLKSPDGREIALIIQGLNQSCPE